MPDTLPHTTPAFVLPDLGEGLQEAEIVTWHVAEGDHVVTDQPLVAVETDKAVVEIPSPYSARVSKLRGAPGDRIAVGDVLVEFEAIAARPDRGDGGRRHRRGGGSRAVAVGHAPGDRQGDAGGPGAGAPPRC